MKTATLTPSRIGCPSIPGTMKGIVNSIEGVDSVTIHYEERSLDVTYDEDVTSVDEIITAVGKEMGLALREGDTASEEERAADTCPM